MKKKNTKSKKHLPDTLELFLGAPSVLVVAVRAKSGAGPHGDKRRKKAREKDWTKESW